MDILLGHVDFQVYFGLIWNNKALLYYKNIVQVFISSKSNVSLILQLIFGLENPNPLEILLSLTIDFC